MKKCSHCSCLVHDGECGTIGCTNNPGNYATSRFREQERRIQRLEMLLAGQVQPSPIKGIFS